MATQQSFLAKLGARLSTLGSAGSLAVAFPLSEGAELMSAHTDATRTGWYATMSAGAQSVHCVAGGQDGFSLTRSGTNVNGAFQGSLDVAPLPSVGTLPPILRVAGPGNFTLTASQEWNAVYFNLSDTTQFDTGPLVEQSAFRIEAPSYAFVGASTISNAATMTIGGAPVAGTNATFTNAYALWVQSGTSQFGSPTATDFELIFAQSNSVGAGADIGVQNTSNTGYSSFTASNDTGITALFFGCGGSVSSPVPGLTPGDAFVYGYATSNLRFQTDNGVFTFAFGAGASGALYKFTLASTGALTLGLASNTTGSAVFANAANAFTVTLTSGVTAASYTLTLPTAQGGAATLLSNDGAGVLSWVATPSSALTATYVGYGSAGNVVTGSPKMVFSPTTGFNVNMASSGANNLTLGTSAGTLLTTGNSNVLLGGGVLHSAASGGISNTVAVGYNAMGNTPSGGGGFHVAIGQNALLETTGSRNTAVGFNAGTNNLGGSYNVFLGSDAGDSTGLAVNSNFVVGSQPSPITDVYIGNGWKNAAGAGQSVVYHGSGGQGTDKAGGSYTIECGIGTGAGLGGSFSVRTCPSLATGVTPQTPVTRWTIPGDGATAWTGIATVDAPAVAAGNEGRIFYDSTLQKFRYSTNLGAYADLISTGATLTATYVGFGSAGNALTGSNKFTWTDTTGSLAITSGTVTASAAPLSISQTWNEGSTIFRGIDLDITNTASLTTSTLMRLRVDSSNRFDVMRTGGTAIRQAALTATSTYAFLVVGGTYTAATASSEITDISFLLARNVQWATSVPALQRAINITAPTYACDTAAQTITTAATVAISGAPIPGTNCAITHSYALWIPSGAVHLGPIVAVDSGALLEATYDTPAKNNGLNVTMFSDSYNPNYGGRRARGTLALPTAVQTGDVLSSYGAVGYGTTGFATSGRAKLQLVASETWTDAAQGAYINFFTTTSGGTSTVECARFSGNGNFRLGVPSTKTGQLTFCNSGTAFNITLQADTTTPASYTLTLPPAQGAASSVLSNDGTGILSWATSAPASLTSTYVGFGSAGNLLTGAAALTYVPAGVGFSYTQAAQNGGGASAIMTLTGGAHTTKDAATEITDIYFNLTRTVQLNAGATVADMRAFRIGAPTYTFTGASAITDADTVEILGPPIAGANATISEACTLSLPGRSVVTGNGAVTTAMGLKAVAPTGATSNFAALFTANTVNPPALTGTVVQVVGANAAIARVGISSFGTSVYSVFSGRSARGTAAAPTASQANDILAAFSGWGYGATGFAAAQRALFKINAAQNWTDAAQGTYITIETTLSGGTTTAERARFQNDGGVTFTQAVVNAAAPNPFLFTLGAHTLLPTGTEANDVYFNVGRTVQWATTVPTTQRAFLISAPTYACNTVGQTITTAATFAITGAPVPGTNCAITNSYALWVQAGKTFLAGGLNVTGAQNNTDQTLTDAATIATDASLGNNFTVTLAASRNMGVPTNPVHKQKIMYKIVQGGAGSFVITWSNAAGGFQFTTGTPAPTLTTTAGKYDYVGFMYDSVSNKWNCLGYTIGLT